MWTDRNGAIGTDEPWQIHLVTEIWTYAKMTTLCAPKTHTHRQILIPRLRKILINRQTQILMHRRRQRFMYLMILLPKLEGRV